MVHEQDIGIAALGVLDRLARTHGDYTHFNSGGLLKFRQNIAEQPGILRGGCGGHRDKTLGCDCRQRQNRH
jgi:hypothetical protein